MFLSTLSPTILNPSHAGLSTCSSRPRVSCSSRPVLTHSDWSLLVLSELAQSVARSSQLPAEELEEVGHSKSATGLNSGAIGEEASSELSTRTAEDDLEQSAVDTGSYLKVRTDW